MATTKTNPRKGSGAKKEVKPKKPFLFKKENYLIMFAGLALFIIGLLLMQGGANTNPHKFNPDTVYSFRRITLAPILIIIGLAIEIFAIMRKPKIEI